MNCKDTVLSEKSQLPQRQKYRSMKQNRKSREIHTAMDFLSLTKKANIHNGEKTVSLTSDTGKTGQPPAKE